MKETVEQKKKRILQIFARLKKVYPNAECALHHSNAFELLVATILSAQCTDKRVNMVTPSLFRRFRSIKDYAEAEPEAVEKAVQSTGFYKNKAKNIIGAAQAVLNRFGGQVPKTMEGLVSLPGVGRKTANVVLGNAFGIPGMPVDTHMIRLNGLLRLTAHEDPVKIETDLTGLLPEENWVEYSHLIIQHGRERCFARKPDCENCEIREFCPSSGRPVKIKNTGEKIRG